MGSKRRGVGFLDVQSHNFALRWNENSCLRDVVGGGEEVGSLASVETIMPITWPSHCTKSSALMRASASLRSKFELKVKAKNEKRSLRLVEEINSEMRHGVPSPASRPPTVFLDESPPMCNPKDDDNHAKNHAKNHGIHDETFDKVGIIGRLIDKRV